MVAMKDGQAIRNLPKAGLNGNSDEVTDWEQRQSISDFFDLC